jgi:hypothetical protein
VIRRLAVAADAIEARLRAWPTACALLLGLLVLLGASMLAG